MYRIMTDTSANLQTDVLAARGIGVVPLSFFVDGAEHTCEDTAGFDGKAFYDAMRRGVCVTTSQIPPQRYVEYFEPLLEAGEDLLFVGMSSGISGSFASAQIAKSELEQRYPERTIRLVDTLSASLGEGIVALKAAEYRDSGMDIQQAAAKLEEMSRRMCQIFTVDDLSYLKRSGRLSSAGALVAAVLNIKPLLKGDDAGEIVCFSKVRGREHSIRAIAKQYAALVRGAGQQTVGIAHADCPEDAELLRRMLVEADPPREIMTVCYEPVTGSHVGPGTLALFFVGDEGFRSA